MQRFFVEVALDLPVYGTFHYLLPPFLHKKAQIGMRVLVPLGKREVTGYIMSLQPPQMDIEFKEVLDLLDDHPLFLEDMAELLQFTANYLYYPLGEVIKGALPAGINIQSHQWYQRTAVGEFALQSGTIRGPKKEILALFGEKEELSLAEILSMKPKSRHLHMNELVEQGFLGVRKQLSKPRITVTREKFYKTVPGFSVAKLQNVLKRSEKQRAVYDWVSHHQPISYSKIKETFESASTPLRALLKKGLLDLEEREIHFDPFEEKPPQMTEDPILTDSQQEAIEKILPCIREKRFETFLLHGVTGSGKTECYIHILRETLQQGRQGIILVPEIALTPQLVQYFRSRIEEPLTVLHSGLSEKQRYEQWLRIHNQEIKVVIGARSAIFSPFSNLGCIIVDEEQESSYKQEGKFPYHARSLSIMRGMLSQASVVLGSATPSFESYYHALKGKWHYLDLPERANQSELPPIEIVDLKTAEKGESGILSQQLEEEIQQTLDKKQQVILFLNRRGYNASVVCTSCGETIQCKHCSVSLTFHQGQGLLICHYCGFSRVMTQDCPSCGHKHLLKLGLGTEQAEELVRNRFPDARVARMDRDTISKLSSLEELVAQFRERQIDILIGTQMLAKGHDFPGVTLVGVILADMGLSLPDFRSSERNFQLLTQVAGRAGRGKEAGKVIIQTYQPQHPSVVFSQTHDFKGFYESEIEKRREGGYPPFAFLVCLRFEGKNPGKTWDVAQKMGEWIRNKIEDNQLEDIGFLGPAPAPLHKIKNQFRWQMLLRSPNRPSLHSFVLSCMEFKKELSSNQVKITLDTDPVSML